MAAPNLFQCFFYWCVTFLRFWFMIIIVDLFLKYFFVFPISNHKKNNQCNYCDAENN